MRIDQSDLHLLAEAGFRPLACGPNWFITQVGDRVACIRPDVGTSKELLLLDTREAKGWNVAVFSFNGVAQCLTTFLDLVQGYETSGWDCLSGEKEMPNDEAAFACITVMKALRKPGS